MTEIQEIDVLVKPDGTVKIEVRGVKGGKCLELTENLEQLLGGTIVERIHTDEFYQSDQEQTEEARIEQGIGKRPGDSSSS